ncbi:putative periplasmic or secreted lipoprotein [Desulfitobacterium dichloroeliminans LMG P-21439]|uniref:Putative periplasmic or secreted lipoprotein n=1 Tax=Desulfitobacterium dichloroeliminans (strain LMG P-21439 / DCA1) TaxID=871963 RepID=L0F966_DESDL|nr:BON domain-containing protein [Desulfitobacterium dichloroeliminans]AGA69488.1 putative periplasmic or secreted lipoprotein [Desulfitobacterium dichloroeliminans LMG P-21439]
MLKIRPEEKVHEDIKILIQTHFGETGQGIHIEVKGDKVSLWGTVDNLAEKDFMGQRIRRVDGVGEVDNSLTVANDGKVTDKDIEKQVNERFAQSNFEEIMHLGCRASRGIVTLLGHLETQSSERLAKRIASQVRGVKEIRSEIDFLENAVDDATLVNRVEDAMVASPWVNAHEIKTEARNGLITLTGLVDSQEEMEWAVDTAYQVPGVKAVVSELFSRHRSQGEDLYMTEQLVRKLGQHGMNSRNVRAFVQGGIAYLSGEVYSDEDRRWAESMGQHVEGIKSTNSAIKVASHSSK